jgi:hypothetical protein
MIEKDRIETVWFFKDKPWVYVKAKNQDPLIIKVKGVQEHYKSIARQGVEFYTCDDDDLDNNYGYYWPEKQLDFEPLDYMQNDSGHTKMFWKDGNKWQQL